MVRCLLALASVAVGTGLALLGRMDSHGKIAYTPERLPGRDPDVAERLASR